MSSRREFLRALGIAAVAPSLNPGAPGSFEHLFETVAPEQSGINWTHDNGRSAMRWLPESMCSGCAFLDYDNDGWMDIFLLNTGPCDFYTPKQPTRSALYRNNRNGTFTDVTREAGLEVDMWGEGVAVGDYDGDGWPDLYVTGYGANKLYRNNRNGTFTDVTAAAGVAAPGWSTSAVWFDYDNDGKLDLFVCSFVNYSASSKIFCGNNQLGVRYYCAPRLFEPRPSLLFHNNGNGTFTEVGRLSDIGKNPAKAHGAVAADLTGSGRMDLFVANDTIANHLFLNRGAGRFEEVGFTAGIAYSESGKPRSGMGVDAADYDGDGRVDLFVANLDRERFSLYHNDGSEQFSDKADVTGIGALTQNLSGWGLKFFDFDNDGNLDLLLSNGHPDDMVAEYNSNLTWKEPLVLLHNTGSGFEEVSRQAGPAFQKQWAARGLAIGDFDNDGGIDVLINNNGGPPLLLHNRIGKRNNWVGVRLIGRSCNVDAVGAHVRWSSGGVVRGRQKVGGGSYLSSHDPRIVCGLGSSQKVDWLEVKWPLPSGKVERFENVPINHYHTIEEGKGIVRSP